MSELQNLSNAVNGRPPSDITIVWDFDGLICNNNGGDYKHAKPIWKSIENLNKMYELGYRVVIATARYGLRHPDKQYQYGYVEAIDWLRQHNVKFHELRMGKAPADLYLDDKGCRVDPKSDKDWETVWGLISELHKKNQYGELLNG